MKHKYSGNYASFKTLFFAYLVGSIVFLSGCTKNFEEINTDPTRLSVLDPLDVRSMFPGTLVGSLVGTNYWASSLTAGLFAQQFASTQNNHSFQRYLVPNSMGSTLYRAWYLNAIAPLENIIKSTQENEPTLNAVARIWKVFVMHRLTDTWGPVPYSQIGESGRVVEFDSQKDIYYGFFSELEEAVVLLRNNINKLSFGDKDLIYKGDNEKWIRFANTLRLRLALRISKVEPVKAKEEAEKSVAGGVMVEPEDNAFREVSPNLPNGMNYQTGWNEQRMSSNFESLFVGWNDPRMSKYFSPALSDGRYRSVRCGMTPAQQNLPDNHYNNTSNVSFKLQPDNMNTTPQTILYTAEAYFLRAEGAVYGWNMGGTAKDLYEEGIEMSMRTWEITDQVVINNYINGTTLPVALNDYFDTPALTDIPVRFSNDIEEQLEQIGTQKWIALFPEPHEAWAEMRRSGYPKMYPLINSDNADVPRNKMIRRLLFLTQEYTENPVAVANAIPLLGAGGDKESTPLWWDKN
ncbi:MAG: SusD/RagB family nutrient-binding outer membrane lipoprotein [Chitinophagaceae bacterium]|nr:SusD/RagB family nutrient-binding outer membrane lipoprotein [Chitinophagaceae bacterium]